MMERQLAHLVRLVDDLLDVSRISRNKMELRRSRLLLSDVVNSAIETARPLIEAAGHTLTVSLPPEPIHLDGDLTRLSQVFSNLLANSAKYTDPGGQICLEVDPSAARTWSSRCATPGSALLPIISARSSACSPRLIRASSGRAAAWVSAWRWSTDSSRCTAGR